MNRIALAVLMLIPLCGCLDVKPRTGNEGNDTVVQPAPDVHVNVPPPQTVDQEEVKSEIRKAASDVKTEVRSSANNTQSNMSGLVNASVSKLGEEITGVKAEIGDVQTDVTGIKSEVGDIKTEVTGVKAEIGDVQTDVTGVKSEVGDIKTEVTGVKAEVGDVKTEVTGVKEMVNDIRLEVGKINALGQAGINNKLEQIEEHVKNNAGRDVNYLPREAVKLMIGIITALCGLATTIVMVLGRNARIREREEADRERENVKYWQGVAMKAIGALDPDKSKDIGAPRSLGTPPRPSFSWIETACSALVVVSFVAFLAYLMWGLIT